MASNKKPSIYSDRGGIGSAEDLDEYGVWVKSEPQDMSAESLGLKSGELSSEIEEAPLDDSLSFDDAVFDVNAGESSKFEDIEFPDDNISIDSVSKDFAMDSDFDDINLETDSLGISSDENIEIEDTNFDEFEAPSGDSGDDFAGDLANEDLTSDFDDFDIAASQDFGVPTVKAIENNIDNIQNDLKESDLSTHLLKKIADELSSIRGELSELKKEFSIVRSPSAEGDKNSFFNEEDDETIALTGDELDNILVNTDEGGQEAETGVEPDADTPVMSEGFPLGGDDEDEAIALTGDELDNILNSADFTEESGTNETPENEFDETPEETPDESSDEDASKEEASISDDLDGLDVDFSAMDDVDLSADFDTDDSTDIADIASDVSDVSLASDTEETSSDDIDIESVSFDDDLAGGISDEEATPSDDIDIESVSFDDSAITDDSLSLDDETAPTETAAASQDIDLGDDIFGETSSDEIDLGDDIFGESASEDIDLGGDIFDDTSTAVSLDDDDAEIKFDEEKDSEELENLRSNGATPVTFPPENSSYLEDDEEHSDIDLSDAVIEEPTLSAEGINDELEEPSIDTDDFDLDALSDLTIDDADIQADTAEETQAEEEPASFEQQFEDDLNNLDIDILAETPAETPEEMPAETADTAESDPFDIGEDDSLSFDSDSDFDLGTGDETPSGFETETEAETPTEPISFKDDLSDDISFDDVFDSDSFDTANDKEEQPIEEAVPVEEAPAPVRAAPIAQPTPVPPQTAPAAAPIGVPLRQGKDGFTIPSELKSELRNILSYMDQLLESLPEEKIEEFAKSEYFDSYKKLFKDLGLV